METVTSRKRAYAILSHAAEQIGTTQYRKQREEHIKKGRSVKTFRFNPPYEQRTLVKMMQQVMNNEITTDEAVAYVHSIEVDKVRW